MQKTDFFFFLSGLHCVNEWGEGDTWPRSETEQLERQAGVRRGLFVWTFSAAFNGTLLILKFIRSWDAVMSVFEGPQLTHAHTKVLFSQENTPCTSSILCPQTCFCTG